MNELALKWSDTTTLPRRERFDVSDKKDFVWIASPPCERILDEPIFVENLQYLEPQRRADTICRMARDLPALEYVVLNDARLAHRWAISDRDGNCFGRLTPKNVMSTARQEGFTLAADSPQQTLQYADEHYMPGATLFMPMNAQHISHFYFQGLPHLKQFSPEEFRVFFPVARRSYCDELLALAGCPEDRVTYVDRVGSTFANDCWRFETLIMPDFWATVHPSQDEVFATIGQKVEARNHDRRIYVTRTDARGARACLNEDELEAMVRRKGIEVVSCSELGGERGKIATFKESSLILGGMGSGLYNVIFSSSPSLVVAINGAEYTDLMLRECATIGRHPYGLFLCPSFLSYDVAHRGEHNDFVIDIKQFERRLDTLLRAADSSSPRAAAP